jgi:hypothetical protein
LGVASTASTIDRLYCVCGAGRKNANDCGCGCTLSLVRVRDVRLTSIVWKNSQNDRSRKSRFRAPNLICAENRHDEAHWRAARGKIARAAEAMPNCSSRRPMAVQIVIDAKNRVFPDNPSIRDIASTSQLRKRRPFPTA